MNRRGFLGTLIGGIAGAAAVRTFPFRVFSFPSEIKMATGGIVPPGNYVYLGEVHSFSFDTDMAAFMKAFPPLGELHNKLVTYQAGPGKVYVHQNPLDKTNPLDKLNLDMT